MPSLDHLFVLVDDLDAAAAPLAAAGFDLGFRRDHPGQGSHNRCLLLAERYLELLALRDPAEAAANALRLDLRAADGGCPFGLAVRGPLPAGRRGAHWTYRHDYGFGPVEMQVQAGTTATPLVFRWTRFGRPADRAGLDPARLRHRAGSTDIVAIALRGPAVHDLPALPGLTTTPAARWHATVVLDGAFPAIDVGPTLRVRGQR